MTNKKNNLNTLCIHGANKHTEINEHVYPIFQSSTFLFKDVAEGAARFAGTDKGYKYTRLGNPNYDILAKRLTILEEGEFAHIYPTGMAAISTPLEHFLSANDHLIADNMLYGCTDSLLRNIISRFGIEISFIDLANEEEFKKNLKNNTKAIILETPTNPTMKEIDIQSISDIAHNFNEEIKVMVDNTFATPIYQRPIELGADISIHSCTKYINGHGDVVAGAAIFNKKISEKINHTQGDLGTTTSPFDCWLMLRGLKTLPLRMERHTENAKKITEFLKNHPQIDYVKYPGFSGMLCFELKKGVEAGKTLLNNVRLCGLAVSLGNVDTLIQHPASMTHAAVPKEHREKIGLTDGLVRLSVGIEDVDDIIEDLEQALGKI